MVAHSFLADTMRNKCNGTIPHQIHAENYNSAAKKIGTLLFGCRVITNRVTGQRDGGLFQAYKWDEELLCYGEIGQPFYLSKS